MIVSLLLVYNKGSTGWRFSRQPVTVFTTGVTEFQEIITNPAINDRCHDDG
jgi:carbamoylphosphate synthase small subunit